MNLSHSRWLRTLTACAVVLLPLCAFALDPAKSVFQFNCQNWTHQNVLPSDGISAITQTKDGYIWLGTQKGLVRFDGLEFKVFPVGQPQAQQGQEIRTFSRSRDGGLWLAINNGTFGYFDGQNFSVIDDEKWALENINAITIHESRDGTVWTGAERGVGHLVKGKPALSYYDENFGMVLSYFEDSHGRVWMGTVEKGLFYWQAGKMVPFTDDSLKQHLIFAMAEDAEGNLWVGTEAGLRCYDASFKPKSIPLLTDEVKALLVDRHGVVWAGTSGAGLAHYQNGTFTFLRRTDGLINDNVTALYEDNEGSMWVGTQDGLSQLTDLKFPIYSRGEGLLPGSTHAVSAAPNGGLWMTTSHGVTFFDGTEAKNYTNETVFSNLWFKMVYVARNNDVYLVDGTKTLEILSGDKIAAKYTNDAWPTTFAEDAEGVLAGVGRLLTRIQDGKMAPYLFKNGQEPTFYWINNLCVAKDGSIWVASNNGVFRIKDGLFRQWSNAEGLMASRVWWVCEDEDGAIWAGTSSGLARIKDNQLKNIGPEHGLFDNKIYAIVPDNQGSFWMDSSRGIFRVERKSLNDFADGKLERIQCEGFDGLKAVKFAGRTDQEASGCKTKDGRIWFPSPKGVVMIDPTHFFTNQVAPPVYIQQIRINGADLKDRQIPNLKPGAGQMEFHFTALSFIAPQKVQVRYQLAGFDSAWVDAGTRRFALYSNLKPGKYSFKVQACNADGVWNTKGDTFDIELPPPFYETGLFDMLCGLLVLAVLIAAYKWKVRLMVNHQRRLQEANELLEVKVSKRTDELARANGNLREEIAEREKADQALAEQRNLLRTLIDNLPDQVFIKDIQSRVVISNLMHAKALGVNSPEQCVGKTDFDFFPPELAQKFFADEQNLLRTGEVFHGEEKVGTTKSGQPRWSQTTKVPMRDSQGGIIGFAGISHDITERKQWESQQQELHKRLVEASRRAGMAEVATGVLHNVGNVLNSVNISVTMAATQIRNSKSTNLAKVVELLRQHSADLGRFLTEDEKGKRLPGYLENLAKHLDSEKAILLKELQSLAGNVDHIKEIVTMQQANARLSGVEEIVPVAALVEDALKINSAAFERHDVKLVKQFDEVPQIMVDRHKVLQILVNLFNNAKYACDDGGQPEKILTVRINAAGKDRVRIEVRDNGIGIPPENLTRIFAHGFTTRKTGHGFGLHSGALAAQELGGTLTAHSDGQGKGASFVLEIPIEYSGASKLKRSHGVPDEAPLIPESVA